MTRTKICGLTNLMDARWAWRCGADLLGFIFVPSSKRFVTAESVVPIITALRAEGCTCDFVGVFADEKQRVVADTADRCGLDLVQLHGDEPPEYARALGLPVIIARRVADRVRWEELADYDAWAYLLDTHSPDHLGGTGTTWDWRLAAGVADRGIRLIIAGGLTQNNVDDIVTRLAPWGVDVASGVEREPGRKDHHKLYRFVRVIRESERNHD